MDKLKFSVLIPTFNGQDVIESTIRSVLYQDYKNYEIIISDDASKDKTLKKIQSFHDKKIKLYENKKNLGYPGNLNRCLKYAKGDIVYLLGQDDILAPNALSRTHNVFLKYPKIAAVTRPYRWFDEDLKTTVRARLPLNDQKDEIITIDQSPRRIVEVFKSLDSLSALAMRKKLIDRPFHPDIFPCHVYPFASIFKKYPIVYLKDYVSSVSMQNSQCRLVSSIYDKSPVLSWVEMFETVFPEKKFKKLRDYCIKNFVAINYVGLAQIKNYSSHNYWFTLREIFYLLRYRPMNFLNPIFWLFSLGALIIPPSLLIFLVDWYKKNVNKITLKDIKFNQNLSRV